MNSFYLILGSESALADRALTKLNAQLKEEKCEITTLFAADTIVGDIADALAPSLFSERRALIIRDLQDLPEDNRDEITRYLDQPDSSTTVIFVHKGGVKGKALLDAIKKIKPELIACDPIKKEAEKEDFVKSLFLDLGRKASAGAVAAEAFLSSTGTSFNLTPDEQAVRKAVSANIPRLRLIMKTPH